VSLNLDKTTWKRVAFGDVAMASKETCDPTDGSVNRYIAGEHMDSDELRIRRWGEVGDGYLGPAFHRRFHPDQVLYGSRRTYLRKVAVAEFDGVCANTTFVVETREPTVLAHRFLPFVMTSEPFHAFAIAESKGSVNPYVNWSDLARYEFDLPPLDEQNRIADLLWAIERERRAGQRLLACGEGLVRVVRGLFMRSGDERRAAEVFDIEIGRQRAPRFQTGQHPVSYMRSANIKRSEISVDDVLSMDFSADEIARFHLERGDVLVTEGCGSPLEIGAPAQWNDELAPPVCFQNTLLRFRATQRVEPGWLWQWAQYAFDEGLFREAATGTGILHIGLKRAKEIVVRLPSAEERKVAVEVLRDIEQALSTGRERAQLAKHLADAMMATIFGTAHEQFQ
jgi:type I restriction enzyme S subunit